MLKLKESKNQIVDQNPEDVFVIKFHEGGYAWDCDPSGGHNFNNTLANQLGNIKREFSKSV